MKEFILENYQEKLRYHDLPGEKVPIIFIHGIGCCSSFDYTQVASMKRLEGHRRILVDLVGAGFSDKPAEFDYTIESHVNYLEAFLKFLELEHFVIYGHSMGGAVSIALASRVEDKLSALILSEANLDSGGGFFSQKIAAYSESDYVRFGHNEIIQESINSSNEKWAASLSISSPIAIHRGACSLIEGWKPSWRQLFYNLNSEKSYIFGSHSLPDSDYQELSDHGIDLIIVPEAGHSMAWENPEGLANAISYALPLHELKQS